MLLKNKVAVFAMCMGVFLCMLDTTIMNITLPAIRDGLSVELNELSWALNSYTIIFAVLTIPLGRIAELYGRNKIYVIGLLIFMLASIACGFSKSGFDLILFRSVQSIGAAIIFPTGMVIGISKTSLDKRKNVIAALGVTQGLAAALGPTIGGLVSQYLGWRWVFFINVPIVLIALLMCFYSLEFKGEERITAKIDLLGAILGGLFLFSLTLSLVKGREWSWLSLPTMGLLVISCLFIFFFIIYERKCKYPIIPLKLFYNKQFIGASCTVILSNLFLVGVSVILPTFLTTIQGENELHAAFLVTPISAMIFIFSPIAAILMDRFGSRLVIFLGFFAMTVSYILLANLDVSHDYFQLIVACSILGFGYGIIVGPITVLAAADFTGELLTASQSVIGVLRQIGTVLAVAIFVSSLTINIVTAKKQIMENAKVEIGNLDLPNRKKEMMYEKVEEQVIKEKNSDISKEQISKSEKKDFTDEDYAEILTVQHINNYAQIHTKEAFLKLYLWSIPFVFLSSFVACLFNSKRKKKKSYLLH